MKSEKTTKPSKDELQNEPDLPLLVELGFTFPAIFLLLLDLMVAGISFVSGATWLDIFIRTVVTTLSVGVVLGLLSMNWSNGILEAVVQAAVDQSKADQAAAAESTAKEA